MGLLRLLVGYQLPVILLLVFLDLVCGVAKALATKTFDLEKLANFYQTQVAPCVLLYSALHIAVKVALMYPDVVGLLGDHIGLVDGTLLGIALAAVVGRLLKSIMASIGELALTFSN